MVIQPGGQFLDGPAFSAALLVRIICIVRSIYGQQFVEKISTFVLVEMWVMFRHANNVMTCMFY